MTSADFSQLARSCNLLQIMQQFEADQRVSSERENHIVEFFTRASKRPKHPPHPSRPCPSRSEKNS